MTTSERVPVLIVGGGVVGLSASLFLARHGVHSLLVERHPGTSILPRARGVNGRTMELLRGVGLETAVRNASAKLGPSVGVYAGTTLVDVLAKRGDGGWLLRRMRKRGVRGQETSRSPTGPCRCTQDELEPVLLEAARQRGVDARFYTELEDFEQDASGVTATLHDRESGERRVVHADYMLAADGARSPVRTKLGVTQSGPGVIAHQLNLYFRADLASLVKGREFSMCLVENREVRGLFASINNTDLWTLHVSYSPETGAEDYPPARCIDLIRAAVGIPDLAVELKGSLPWQSTVRTADGFQHGRVFLGGDAAHVMPPWGGFGANTGIQDAHNLAWKLAAVLDGSAGPALLATYDSERRPVARHVSEIAGSMSDARGLMTIPRGLGVFSVLWQMRRVFPYATMGYGYSSDAVVLEAGAPPGPGTSDLRGRPGTRGPHLWLERNGARISSIDLFGERFVLLAAPDATAWCTAIAIVAEKRGMRIDAVRLGSDVSDPRGRCAKAYGLNTTGACLVRPDGIVAWRSAGSARDPVAALERVFDQILAAPARNSLRESAVSPAAHERL